MLSITTAKWVAIYTQARSEKMVMKRLEEQGFEAYLPIVEVKRHWSDRIKLVQVPLFNSYVFVRIKKNELIHIRNTQGVVRIVSFNNEVATIHDSEIESIRRFVSEKQEIFVEETRQLRKGAKVEIIDGPFTGMKGILVDNCKNGNFAVRIDAIGVSLVTHIDRLMLKVRPEK